MNIKYITYLFSSLFFSSLIVSCNDNNNETTYGPSSKDAQIYSFVMSAPTPKVSDSIEQVKLNKIFAIVNKTKFAIDQVGGIIYNPDSLPYGTILNKVLLTPTFNATYGVNKVTVYIPDSVAGYNWNITDSVFVKKSPISIQVVPKSGNSDGKRYQLDIRIHKIDPDVILWNKMDAYPAALGESKTILAKYSAEPTFFTYTVVGGAVKLYTSPVSTISWAQRSVSGLPTTLKPKSIFVLNNVFYAIDNEGKSYKSGDGVTWVQQVPEVAIESVLGILPEVNASDDQLLITYKNAGKYYFGKTKDLKSVSPVTYLSISPSDNQVPPNFPLSGAAMYTNHSASKNNRMLILAGGLDKTGAKALNNTWVIKNVNEGLELSPSQSDTILFSGKGVSLFAYNNLMYTLQSNKLYTSSTWGEKWLVAPSKQILSKEISIRKDQSVIIDDRNYIWIFGGVSENGTYLNDVWRGRLNSLIPKE